MRDQIDFIYNAAETKRFHTFPVLRTETIAQHSWRVAMLIWTIFGQDEPGITLPVLMAALTHDAAEYEYGDLPAPAKRSMGQTLKGEIPHDFKFLWDTMEQEHLAKFSMDWEKYLTPTQLAMLKFCDSLDGAYYCVTERSLGNQQIVRCWVNFSKYINALIDENWVEGYSDGMFEVISDSIASRVIEAWEHAKSKWRTHHGDR